MTLTYYNSNQELMSQCVLWWQGRDQTSLGFPILPAGVTVTPNGSWTDNTTGVTRSVKNFNGTDAYISLTDNDAWDFHNGSMTVCLWWKPIARTYRHIFASQYQSASPLNVSAFYYYPAGNAIYLQRCIANTYDGSWYCALTPVDGTWYHIAVTKSGTSTPTFYINGIAQTTIVTHAQVSTTAAFSAPVTIGKTDFDPDYTNGNLKDFMIHNRTLTQPEIVEIMRLTNPASGRDFAAIYPGNRSVE